MTTDEVVAFYAALSEGRFAEIEAVLDEDVFLAFPGSRFGARVEGRRKVLIFLRQNQRLFDGGLRFRVHWAGQVEDRTVAQWTNTGRTKTGVDYTNRGCTIFTTSEAGRIVEIQDYLDTERLAETWPR